jgi:predicted metalloprotease with PDZ domain
VFISYSSADRKTAERICFRLEQADLACWMAPRDIAPGADWGEAIELFAKYGDLFSAEDPTARRFSEIAQQFTRQAERLGVAGGMYIYEVVPNSPAAKAGLRPGDILVGLGPEAVTEQKQLDAAGEKYLPDAEVKVTYLRADASGELSAHTTHLSNGPMGLRMMPI